MMNNEEEKIIVDKFLESKYTAEGSDADIFMVVSQYCPEEIGMTDTSKPDCTYADCESCWIKSARMEIKEV